ncbi:MAG: hypothetical protein ACRECF_00740 [Methyloceanibacter sp.]
MSRRPGYRHPTRLYQHPDLGDDPRPDPYAKADAELRDWIGGLIQMHYPNHPWRVSVEHKQGMIMIQIPQLMGATNWYTIPMQRVAGHHDLKRKVINGCGDILERYQIPRAAFSPAEFLRALNAIPAHKKFHGLVPQ